ncbi:MAG: type II toxin-antitoxin system prevent-host-death family antitoxin [Pseudolysinimonas sp.]|uniref:type II toxin-antitoxin system Phd/YefM family antitoxin n=1 Tax=Pseudolysinimonas sp. TaxID=2680009 RepID=UPI003C76AF10
MANIISVGELRQNPTPMLREVRGGATYIVTDHGEPVAEISPRRRQPWVRAAEVDTLLRELGPDPTWEREIGDARAAEGADDPWERTR